MFAELITLLNAPVATVFAVPVSWAEALGFVTGAWCVWLVAKQNLWSWPIGIANNLMFLLLFATAGLYADSGLQVVYICLAIYGWWAWMFGGKDQGALAVSSMSQQTALRLGAATVLATAALYALLSRVTDSDVALWDSLTTALSLAATYAQCRKQLQCWWIWIAADLIYIPLYAYKGLWLTAILYVGFLLLCVNGYMSWRKSLAPAAPVLEAAA